MNPLLFHFGSCRFFSPSSIRYLLSLSFFLSFFFPFSIMKQLTFLVMGIRHFVQSCNVNTEAWFFCKACPSPHSCICFFFCDNMPTRTDDSCEMLQLVFSSCGKLRARGLVTQAIMADVHCSICDNCLGWKIVRIMKRFMFYCELIFL